MTTNAALAFCSDAWLGLILNVFGGPQGGHKFHWGAAAPLAPLGTAPEPIELQFGIIDYVRQTTPHAKISSRRKRGVGWGYGSSCAFFLYF